MDVLTAPNVFNNKRSRRGIICDSVDPCSELFMTVDTFL